MVINYRNSLAAYLQSIFSQVCPHGDRASNQTAVPTSQSNVSNQITVLTPQENASNQMAALSSVEFFQADNIYDVIVFPVESCRSHIAMEWEIRSQLSLLTRFIHRKNAFNEIVVLTS